MGQALGARVSGIVWVDNLYLFFYLFTSFSGHRPVQRECTRTGLWSHARCHPYPIPQPVKVDHTTGIYDPYSFRIVMWVLLRPTRTNQWKSCETGPTVFSSLSEKTRKSNHLQMSLQRQHFLKSFSCNRLNGSIDQSELTLVHLNDPRNRWSKGLDPFHL